LIKRIVKKMERYDN